MWVWYNDTMQRMHCVMHALQHISPPFAWLSIFGTLQIELGVNCLKVAYGNTIGLRWDLALFTMFAR